MSKKIIQLLLILLFFFTLGTSISSQESLEEILYRDFKDVETFGYINVKVQENRLFQLA